MRLKHYVFLLIVAILVTGCSTTVKHVYSGEATLLVEGELTVTGNYDIPTININEINQIGE